MNISIPCINVRFGLLIFKLISITKLRAVRSLDIMYYRSFKDSFEIPECRNAVKSP